MMWNHSTVEANSQVRYAKLCAHRMCQNKTVLHNLQTLIWSKSIHGEMAIIQSSNDLSDVKLTVNRNSVTIFKTISLKKHLLNVYVTQPNLLDAYAPYFWMLFLSSCFQLWNALWNFTSFQIILFRPCFVLKSIFMFLFKLVGMRFPIKEKRIWKH